MENLIKAQNLKKQLDDLRPIPKEIEAKILQKFRLDWNFHSNNLEGNSLTYGETKWFLLYGNTASGKPFKDYLEIKGHNEAINLVYDVVKSNREISENFIRELHILILKEPYEVGTITPDGKPTKKIITIGEYKKLPNHVKTKTGEIFYFAEPFETPSKMHDLIYWYENEIKKTDVNPIILAAEFHYKFIRIHPFDDGNGRLGRILMNLILMRFGFPPAIIKTQDKENYLNSLRKADVGFIEDFIDYIAKNSVHSLEIMIKGANGEEIEEEDDLDKKIALLKADFKDQKNFSTLQKSQEVILKIFDDSCVRVFEELNKECAKFDEFYQKKILLFHRAKKLPSNLIHGKELRNLEDLRNEIDDSTVEISLTIKHESLKKLGKFYENFESKILFSFDLDSYRFKSQSQKFQKFYNQQLTNEEIKLIIKEIAKQHYQKLKSL